MTSHIPIRPVTIRAMENLMLPGLDAYLEQFASPESDLLARLHQETYAKLDDPQMQLGSIAGGFLRIISRLLAPQTIVEVGTYSGYSGLCLAQGLKPSGELHTFDRNPSVVAIARRYFDQSPQAKQIHTHIGDAREELQQFLANRSTQSPSIDLVFIDADKESYIAYWELLVPHVRPGGILLADNTLWGGKVLHPESASDYGVVKFNEHVKNDSRVEQVLLAIRDGIMMAQVRAT